MCNRPQKTHVHLALQDKLDILEAVNERGVKGSVVAKKYRISNSVISRLKKQKEMLKGVQNMKPEILEQRKVIKPVHNANLEEALIMWFNEKRLLGEPVSGPMICEKALILNGLLNGSDKFKASNGWLHGFKRRHGIKQLSMQGEKLSADVNAAIEFSFKFQNLIEEEDYDLSLVFNADESGFYWKSLPQKTLVGPNEAYDNSGCKTYNDRVTVLFCTNADGSFTLPLLIIANSKKPPSLENIEPLPVVYEEQTSALMDENIFYDWYKNNFIPSVEEFQTRTNKYGKVLLLLDNAKCHPPKEVLDAVNNNFKIEYFPANVNSLIQPLEQGIIMKAKHVYRQNLIKSLTLINDEITVQDFMKSFNLNDCCFMLEDAFKSVTQESSKNAWNKLRGVSGLDETDVSDSDDSLNIKDLQKMIKKIKGLENIHRTSLKVWLSEDQYDSGWKLLTDGEIIGTVTGQKSENINDKTLIEKAIPESIQLENISAARTLQSTIHFLHDWCKQRKEYTLSDYRTFRKWENLAMEESQQEIWDSSDISKIK